MSNQRLRVIQISTLTGLVREIRPWQWYKQGVMLLAIVFSQNLFNPAAWSSLLTGIVSFTSIASATYIFNDISDIEEDRNHRKKQHRPIASGQVSILVAILFGIILTTIGFLTAYSIGPFFLAVLFAYIAQNALYSVVLKNFVFVDVLIVAIGFVFRAVAGAIAIDESLSPWLIIVTFLFALLLAFGKRRNELEITTNPQKTRDVLSEYSKSNIDQLLVMVMATLLMSYTLYTFSQKDLTMMCTLPFAFFGVFRYHYLVHTTNIAGQPEYLFTDRSSVVNVIIWGIVVIAVLYNLPEMAIKIIQ